MMQMFVRNPYRSKLTAAWAAFFGVCKADYIYRPKTYMLEDWSYYTPDFLVRNVKGRCDGDLFVEVSDRMTDDLAQKIKLFADKDSVNYGLERLDNPVLVVGALPYGDTFVDIVNDYDCREYDSDHPEWPPLLNFELIDGDYYGAHICLDKEGRLALFGDDCNYLADADGQATVKAFQKARNICDNMILWRGYNAEKDRQVSRV